MENAQFTDFDINDRKVFLITEIRKYSLLLLTGLNKSNNYKLNLELNYGYCIDRYGIRIKNNLNKKRTLI